MRVGQEIRMKVAFPMLGLTGRPGGEKVITRLADALNRKGYEVTIMVPKGKWDRSYAPESKVVEVPLTPVIGPALPKVKTSKLVQTDMLSSVMPFARILHGFDAAVANFAPTTLPVRLGLEKKKGFYLVQHDETLFFPRYSLEHWISRMSYGAFGDGHFFTVSKWLKEMIKDRSGHEAAVIPPGINHSAFYPRKRTPHEGKEVLFMARPLRWRGIEVLLEAMERVKKTVPELRLVATGKLDPTIVTDHKIEFINPSDDELALRYASADVFVLPSLLEGMPVPPLEAMACGGCVVLTDCKGPRDYAVNNENCFMVPPGDVGALAEAVTKVLTDETLSQRLRGNGPKTAAPWTYERMERMFVEAFEKVLA